MRDFDTYVAQIEEILGVKVSDDGALDLRVKYDDSSDGDKKRCLSEIRLRQKALRMLKRDVNYTISVIIHQYQNDNALVGKGIGSFFTTLLFGSRVVGKYNTLTRSLMRNAKTDNIAPYEGLKNSIDAILYELDRVKHKIELRRK